MTITAIALVTLGALAAIAAKNRRNGKEAVVLVRDKRNRKKR